MSFVVVPITLREANEFVLNFHRHNKPVQGAKFCIGASDGETLLGVAIVGRPVSRLNDDGFTAEVTRLCVLDDSPKNTCSFLYGRAWRIWQQMGGRQMITYTLKTEPGSSLRGAGWKLLGETARSGSGWLNRPGREWQPTHGQLKFKWAAQ